MKRTVTVLQDDIDHGVRGITEKCAIARALRRDLADLFGICALVTAWPDTLYLGRDQVPTPRAVADFIYRFDQGFPVEPFKFEIEIEVPQ